MIRVHSLAGLLSFLLIGFVVLGGLGCNKSKSNLPAGPDPAPDVMAGNREEVLAKLPGGAEFAAGKRVYANNGCVRCHKLGETGGGGGPAMGGPPPGPGGKGPRGGSGGPDLSRTGADPVHTKEWIAAHIRDPKSHQPRSRMPASGPDKINDADLDALAAYLASRK